MSSNLNIARNIFHVFCFLLTAYCVYKCFYQWSLDLDISLVEHKQYGDDPNYIKPTMSMCFMDPFESEAFKNNTQGVNLSDYKKFLFGNLKTHQYNPALFGIDFESVTKKFEDYLIGYFIHWQNDSLRYYDFKSSPPDIKKPHVSYIGLYYNLIAKCYSLDFPLRGTYFRTKPCRGCLDLEFHFITQINSSNRLKILR